MQPILLSLAAVLLAAAFVVRVPPFAVGLAATGIGLFGYLGVDALQDDTEAPRYKLTSVSESSGGTWLKFAAVEDGVGRPAQWSCNVTSFSGQLHWRVSKRALLERETTWPEGEIIVRFPHDFRGPGRPPPPGWYVAECDAFVAAEDGSIVQVAPATVEFKHE